MSEEKSGRLPASGDRATRASPRAPAGLGHAASVTDATYGWQPIGTAPMDGSGVQLIDMSAPAPAAGFGAFVFDFWTAINPDGFEDDRDFLDAKTWISPTHWRPFPPEQSS